MRETITIRFLLDGREGSVTLPLDDPEMLSHPPHRERIIAAACTKIPEGAQMIGWESS
jgi:hypothetical protein